MHENKLHLQHIKSSEIEFFYLSHKIILEAQWAELCRSPFILL